MKKIYSIFLLTIATVCMKAASYTVTVSGLTYAPAALTVTVGDVVTIIANGTHPLVEVSQTTWNANGTTPLGGGFGTKTSTFTFTISTANTIYYVCSNHASMGMKGQINVNAATGVTENSNVLSNLSVFPNPAKDNKFSVKFNTTENVNVTAKLYSVCGQEVEALVANKEFNAGVSTINIELQSNTPSGIYFLQLTYNSKKVVKKVIID